MSCSEKVKKSNYVIENNSTFQNLYEYATEVAYNIVDYINNKQRG